MEGFKQGSNESEDRYNGKAIIGRFSDYTEPQKEILDKALNMVGLDLDQVISSYADFIDELTLEERQDLVVLVRNFQNANEADSVTEAKILAKELSKI